jgi:hypothetical protein
LRFGSDSDGGYLLTEDASRVSALFSPGVGLEAGFEEIFARRGIDCFLADASVDGPPLTHDRIHFLKKYLGEKNNDSTIRLDSWIDECVGPARTELGMQMDIEGAEYAVLGGLSEENLPRFRFLIIEFHDLNKLVNHEFLTSLDGIIDVLSKTHLIVHTHANNATPPIKWENLTIFPTLEIVALRKDIVSGTEKPAEIPNSLDRKNLAHRRDWAFKVDKPKYSPLSAKVE